MDTESFTMPQLIPKIVIFFDSKKKTYNCLAEYRNWLQKSDQHRYSKKQAKETIKIFHRNIAQFDKEQTINEFRRLCEDSSVRVIFATEALEAGVDLFNI